MSIRNIITGVVVSVPILMFAQDPQIDTIPHHDLQEVVVSAPKVLHKADMDLFIPSPDAKALSKNGMQLLQNLKIPSLTVNEVLGTVSSLGSAVEIRINGRVASVDQMKALSPDDIKRVEWIENPGLKYKGANAVINLIVRNPGLGGSLMAQAMPALTTPWGQGNASIKLNNGKSQWGVDLTGKVTDVNVYRDYYETFTYPDGSRITRDESPLGKLEFASASTAKIGPFPISPRYWMISPHKVVFPTPPLPATAITCAIRFPPKSHCFL